MRLIDADKFKKQVAGMAIINGYQVDKANKICELIDCQPTAEGCTDETIAKIIEDLDARIDNQLKILAGIGDEAHRYGFVKALEVYQQCKLIVEQNFEEYKRK